MASVWRHVRAILMSNKGLRGLLSWPQFTNYHHFICMKWRIIHNSTELTSRIFEIVKIDLTIFQKIYLWKIKIQNIFDFFEKPKYIYRAYQGEQVLEISARYITMTRLQFTRHFVLLYMGQSIWVPRDVAYNPNAYLIMFQTFHNKVNDDIGFLSSNRNW